MTDRDVETEISISAESAQPSVRDREPRVSRANPRVLMVISSLRAGGAERVLSRMANYWAERDWPVALVTLEPTSADFYSVSSSVRRIGLNASGVSTSIWRALWSNRHRIQLIRDAIREWRPDVVISFMVPTTIITLLAARTEHVPVIVSERTDPSRAPLARVWAALRRFTYPWAVAVVVQTPEVERWADAFLRKERVHVIPNPIAAPPGRDDTNEPITMLPAVDRRTGTGVRHVVAMGRMDANKGFDQLIRAFAQCRASRPDWQLTILGDGEQRPRLEALATSLGVRSHVHLPGTVADPTPTLRGGDMFVLSSRYEGFPNALLEAMAIGLPVIATGSRGSSHIVRNDVDGVLVPVRDVAELATAMAALMDDEPRRQRLGRRAMEVTERFNVERIMATWESVVDEAVAHRPSGRHGGQT